jgi:hypothetical protein
MDADDFRRRIVQAWHLIEDELDIGRTVSSLLSLSVNKEFNAVALSPSSTYREIYISAVSLSYYNIMLNDYAIFQYSWESVDSWRLAYLPNPWISGVEEAERTLEDWEALESLGGLHQEEVASLIDELPYHAAIPAIRFEYAVEQYEEIAHPAAHLHIGRHTENRWALARPLDPLTFTMSVIRLYYPSVWNPISSFHGAAGDTCIDRRFMAELNKMRIVHQFTENERRSLHLTSQ